MRDLAERKTAASAAVFLDPCRSLFFNQFFSGVPCHLFHFAGRIDRLSKGVSKMVQVEGCLHAESVRRRTLPLEIPADGRHQGKDILDHPCDSPCENDLEAHAFEFVCQALSRIFREPLQPVVQFLFEKRTLAIAPDFDPSVELVPLSNS